MSCKGKKNASTKQELVLSFGTFIVYINCNKYKNIYESILL